MLAIVTGVLVIGSRVAARRITRRLEALETGVGELGSGVLSARVRVDGDDEVASLARRFNWAAERIERLVESQRRVLASASHEFRSPLARLRMALELIRDDTALPERRRRIDESVADIEELDALVEDLLLAERLTVGKKEPREDVDLAKLVEGEARRVRARTEIAPAIVNGEARLLRRLVRNLIENAKRHAGGADITVGVGMVLEREKAQIWVADRGPGIPADERERIFEPFYRSRSHAEGEEGGVGLGLALVRQIARHHGGDVTCEAREGGGTVFRVTLGAKLD
jgi:signal transduction histidine kinase